MSAQPEGRSLRHFFAGRIKAWDRFWFRPADPTTLGLIRILAGLMLLTAAVRFFDRSQRRSYGPTSFYELPEQSQRLDLSV